ncbi:MAG: hypothetical protein IT306_18400 [Chloroflexi bacterium]|nr:hypothetical protein [Chloroflexota bacterium]
MSERQKARPPRGEGRPPKTADAIPDEFVRPIALGGSPVDVRVRMDALIAAGADEIVAFPLVAEGETVQSTIDLFAEACGLHTPTG